eukprot:SAG31_NODE_1314_length_8851_cov_7.233318_10_plen_186_part_00
MTDLLLLGDLGGTNCRLELVPSPVSGAAAGTGSGRPSAVHKARYRTADHPSLAAMLTKFVKETPWENFPKAGHETKGEHDVSRAPMLCCLSVCGPVTVDPESGAQQSVLLAPVFGAGGWTLNSKDLSTAVGCQVLMLNDFHSVGLVRVICMLHQCAKFRPPLEAKHMSLLLWCCVRTCGSCRHCR